MSIRLSPISVQMRQNKMALVNGILMIRIRYYHLMKGKRSFVKTGR